MAQPLSETVLDEAMEFLAQGKRYMALDDYQSATDHLEQSCQLFDAYYGIGKRECADAYLEYGLALVALANAEAGSGTDRLMKKAGIEEGDEGEEDEEGQDDDDDDEEAADDEQVDDDEAKKDEADNDVQMKDETGNDDASKSNDISKEPQQNGTSTNNHQTKGTSDHENQPQPSASTNMGNESEIKAGTSSGITGDDINAEEEDNDATTIEIAWEVLCLAKRTFMTDESMEGRMKLAETLQKLGEISIEWDNNDNAVSILEECLNIRKAILEPGDRLIALTYYHLGLAYSFKEDTPNANDNFSKAIEVIEKRIVYLEKLVEKSKQDQDTASVTSYQKEINELKELLPDMTMRLDDSKEDASKGTEAFKRTIEEQALEDETAKRVCLDKSKPVDNISHLVKRKTD